MSEITSGTVIPSTFVWIIDRFRYNNGRLDKSPEFHQLDSSWYLNCHSVSNWIHIYLCRGDSGPLKTMTYTIKVKNRTGFIEITETKDFASKHDISRKLSFSRNDEKTNSDLLITCYIKSDTSHPVAGRTFVNSAVQTEDGSSMTEKENPKDEDLSSLSMKGRTFVNSGVQTEDGSSVTEKENSKDKDLSSLSMKGVAALTERMKELLIKGIDHDVTICVQDKEFRAHRSILSARSPVFAMMLAHDTNERNTNTINIEDCDPESFDEFLLYVYSGRTENLTPSNAVQLYYPADKYDFPELKERCVSLLKSSLSVESLCEVVLLATKYQEKELLEVATEFFARNVAKILVNVNWLNFALQNPKEAYELHLKSSKILYPEN